jgi:hypothetical protein
LAESPGGFSPWAQDLASLSYSGLPINIGNIRIVLVFFNIIIFGQNKKKKANQKAPTKERFID